MFLLVPAHPDSPGQTAIKRLLLLSHHMVVWGILSLLCVCQIVCFFVCTITDFSAAEKARA